MLKLSVCIEMFWEGRPEEEKIRKVKGLGLPAFEFWGLGKKNVEAMRAAQDETGMVLAAMCMSPAAPLVEFGSEAALVKGLKDAARAARTLKCSRIIATTGNAKADVGFEATRRRVVRGLKALAPVAEGEGVTLVLEPLNPIVDHAGYWLNRTADAVDVIEEVGSKSVKILYDIYHQQITEGNVIDTITRYVSLIGHFHAAGVPGRNELTGGELDYRSIFKAIEKTGYDGYVGLEFSPKGEAEKALAEALGLAGGSPAAAAKGKKK